MVRPFGQGSWEPHHNGPTVRRELPGASSQWSKRLDESYSMPGAVVLVGFGESYTGNAVTGGASVLEQLFGTSLWFPY
jgi:hypothetical protein